MFFFFFWSLLVCMRNYPDFVSINHWIVVGLLTFDYYISIQVVVVDHKNPWKLPTNTTLDYTKIGRSRSNEYFTLAPNNTDNKQHTSTFWFSFRWIAQNGLWKHTAPHSTHIFNSFRKTIWNEDSIENVCPQKLEQYTRVQLTRSMSMCVCVGVCSSKFDFTHKIDSV